MRSHFFKLALLITCALIATITWSQAKKISGRIISEEDGKPLPGVSVLIKGKAVGTQTDTTGEYSIDAVEGDVLVFSYTGFEPQEATVGSSATVDLYLKSEATKLGEVVVVGYGSQSRKNITTAIAKLDKEVLASAPRSNVATALQGTVSGLQVVNATGQPGAAPLILLRGGASINNPGSPLVIVDGVIRPLNDLASDDIASIELLKDAASTAIYGARANNGVILVTTKQGKAGKGEISYKFTYGYNKQREGYNYLGAKDFIYLNRLGNLNSSRTLTDVNNSRGFGLNIASDTASFDIKPYNASTANLLTMGWDTVGDPYGGTIIFKDHGGEVEDLIFRNTYTRDHYISAMGGNDRGRYFASFNYYNEDGIIVGSGYQRYSGDLSGSYKIKRNLEVSSGATFSTSSQLGVNGSEINNMYRNLSIWPTFNPWIDAAKTKPNPGNGINDGNPLYWLSKTTRSNEVNRITGDAAIKWDLLPGLYVKLSGNFYLAETLNQSFTAATQSYAQLLTNTFNTTRPASSFWNRDFQQTYTGIINYTKNIHGMHNLGAMVGAESYNLKRFQMQVSGTNAPTDDIPTVNASTVFPAGSNFSTKVNSRIHSFFSRVNYDFDQRFLLTLVLRADGVSSLAEDERWGYFPGMSAGWNIHREGFFTGSSLADVISTLKPRISYGQNGNIAGIGPYEVQGIYASQGNYGGSSGFLNTSIVNSGLQWEKSKTIDVGLDLGFLKDRFTLIFDYFDRKTEDLLTNLDLPDYVGFPTVRTNLGTYQNRGYEFAVNANILRLANGLTWNFGINATFIENKILRLPYNGQAKNRQGGIQVIDPKTGQLVWVGGLQEGETLGEIYAYQQVSIFRDDAEISKVAANRYDDVAKIVGPNLPLNANNLGRITPGDVNWLDIDKNDTIDSRDQVRIGNIIPKWTGGFSTTVAYKGFSLYGRFEFALGHTIYNDLVARTLGNYQGTFNYIDLQYDAWSPTNLDADIPKVYSADQRAAPQGKKNFTRSNNASANLNSNNSRFYEKADYLACREITLSYDVAKSLLAKTKVVANARLFASALNLFYITDFSGPTPEAPVNTAGVVTGVYQGTYPTPRTFVIGAQLTF